VVAGSVLRRGCIAWVGFLAGLGGVSWTFLAGVEADLSLFREKLKPTLLTGGSSVSVLLVAAFGYCYFAAARSLHAAEIVGAALSRSFAGERDLPHKLRGIAFGIVTPSSSKKEV
jgi:hypothetical protein